MNFINVYQYTTAQIKCNRKNGKKEKKGVDYECKRKKELITFMDTNTAKFTIEYICRILRKSERV